MNKRFCFIFFPLIELEIKNLVPKRIHMYVRTYEVELMQGAKMNVRTSV